MSKYGKANDWEFKKLISSHSVGCWKGIMHLLENFKEATWEDVSSRRKTSFWYDKWCSDRPLRIEAPTIYAISLCKDSKLANCWNAQEGGWNILPRRNLNV